ncbi:MAG TPA: sulfatase-like hydrolase/transferase [bacterium]|nr:sulfatase-like hydrolase/transferase [bacterium]HPN46171.1 sulfatase-like hydrolase/transferase [bacterium]
MHNIKETSRRAFIKTMGTAALTLPALSTCGRVTGKRPNILWLVSEDNGPFLGCYGDAYAATPNLDKLAAEGILYENAFCNAPVCAPSRSTIITGMYACSLGTHYMRSLNHIPKQIRFFTEYLRDAGYYCSNNAKEDYNTQKPESAWDESSREATYLKRGDRQPFFSVFNFETSHESCLHSSDEQTVHDPAGVKLPPYHPDTPEFRHDWAQYYDRITELDKQIGAALQKLEDAGLAEDTIVFYYADNGGVLPRSKRFLYDSGVHVPLIVRVPKKFQRLVAEQPGTRTDRLVSFVDLAATALSLAGVSVPEYMQGRAFLGPQEAAPRDHVYLFRDRMDERYDMMRAVRDKQFKYIRNYMPQRPWAQYLNYLWRMPAMQSWQRLHDEGNLAGAAEIFWQTKPAEELYDIKADPHEVHNLAGDPQYKAVLERLRKANNDWVMDIHDAGFLPEAEMVIRTGDGTPFEMARDAQRYNLPRYMEALDLANSCKAENVPQLISLLKDADSGVRVRAAEGLLALGAKAAAARAALEGCLDDESPNVRLAAAEALCKMGVFDKPLQVMAEALHHDNVYVRLHAANALDYQDEAAKQYLALFNDMLNDPQENIVKVMKKALADLEK